MIMYPVNLTPHPLRVFSGDGTILIEIPPSGEVARLVEIVKAGGTYAAGHPISLAPTGDEVRVGIPYGYKILTGEITGWDPSCPDDCYVSLPFAVGAAALGLDTSHLLVSLRDHRNADGAVDGTYAIGPIEVRAPAPVKADQPDDAGKLDYPSRRTARDRERHGNPAHASGHVVL